MPPLASGDGQLHRQGFSRGCELQVLLNMQRAAIAAWLGVVDIFPPGLRPGRIGLNLAQPPTCHLRWDFRCRPLTSHI